MQIFSFLSYLRMKKKKNSYIKELQFLIYLPKLLKGSFSFGKNKTVRENRAQRNVLI